MKTRCTYNRAALHPGEGGFTLIEVLVAVVVFAIMAAMAYRGLTAILDSKRQIDAENDKWRRVAILFTRVERDLAVAVPRPVRDAARPYAPAMSGEAVANGEYGTQLAFTRMGSDGDAGTFGAPQRVGYRLRDGNVEVLLWPVLDQAPRTIPEVSVLVSNIGAMSFSYLDGTGQKQARWPLPGAFPQGDPRLPSAVELTLTLKSGEVLTRLFDLPPFSVQAAPTT